YHCFVCSQGTGGGWDDVREVVSSNGATWSEPTIILTATGSEGQNEAACDPSIAYLNGYYYLAYSSAIETGSGVYQTVIQIARATAIDGPYLTWSQTGEWQANPEFPAVVIYPRHIITTGNTGYGAGQQVIVPVGDELYMWWNDDSADPGGTLTVYFATSSDGTTWSTPVATNFTNVGDVKWNGSQFVMLRMEGQFTTAPYLDVSFSSDGLTWSGTTVIAHLAPYSSNPGMLGDEIGNLLAPTLVGYAAPYDFADQLDRGQWDLYGEWFTLP
ncbi:MAG TPA: hypothetical protein VI756_12465, partial [Blastocatellia bacterium]